MKILLINNLHRRRGGADIVYLNTGQLLKDAGHEVIYFSMNSEDNEPCEQESFFAPSLDGFLKPKAALNYFYNKSAATSLDELLRDTRPDVACVHLVWGGLTASIFTTLHHHQIPVVHVVHDYRMICPAYTFKRTDNTICEECKGGHYIKCFKYKCSKGSSVESLLMALEMYFRQKWHNPINEIDGFVFVSHFCKDKHVEFDNRYSRVPSIVLYNCSKVSEPKSIRDNYYLFYGRLSYEKGITTLLHAAGVLKDCRFKIVGTGPLESMINDTIQQNRLDNVELLGYKKGNDLTEIISKSKFVIVPSEWYENNPMTIVEAYSMGVPVIGANIGGIPEIIREGKTGFVFDSGEFHSLVDCVKQAEALSDEDYVVMCQQSHVFAKEHFDEVTYVKKLVSFLADIKLKYISS